jgi:hypothetical protein
MELLYLYLVHLVGFMYYNIITMHGTMNIKKKRKLKFSEKTTSECHFVDHNSHMAPNLASAVSRQILTA